MKHQEVTLQIKVRSAGMSPKKVAALINRLIDVGLEEANDSLKVEHHKDTETVLALHISKAKVVQGR